MKADPLIDIVIDTILFLEVSESDVVQPDVAVAMLEQIAAALQRFRPEDRERLVNYIPVRVRNAKSDEERRALQSLTMNMGL